MTPVLYDQFDAGSNGGTVGLYAHEFYADPVVAGARIPEQGGAILVAPSHAALFNHNRRLPSVE